MFAPRLDSPVNNMCFYFAINRNKIRFNVCFLIVTLKKCPLRFSHKFTVLS